MPLTKFQCPDEVSEPGRLNDPSFCIHSCKEQCLPMSVLNAIWCGDRSNVHRGEMITATSLPRCPRKFLLMRSEDYAEEPKSLYSAMRGTLIHKFIEDSAALPGVKVEQRVFKTITTGPLAPWVISGQVDVYDSNTNCISDFKTSADKGTWVLYNKGIKADHIMQVNTYRWLLDGGNLGSVDGPVIHWPVDEMVIHTLFMTQVISSGRKFTQTFQEFKEPNYGRRYPYEVKGSRKLVGKTRRNVPIWQITFDLPAVPILDFEEVEEYVEDKGETLIRGFRQPGWMPSGIMNDEDLNWECGYCPVKDRCDKIEEASAVFRHFEDDKQIPLFEL